MGKRSRAYFKSGNKHRIPKRSRGYLRVGGYYSYGMGSNLEEKFTDRNLIISPVPVAGSIDKIIPDIPTGTGEKDRIGRQITVTKFFARFTMELPPKTDESLTADLVRVMLIMDRQVNGLQPVVLDVLETAGLYSFNNLANRYRFKVLSDKIYTLNAQCAAYDGSTFQSGRMHKQGRITLPKLNCPMEFSSTAGTTAETRSCGFWILTISENAVTTIGLTGRWRFIDGHK